MNNNETNDIRTRIRQIIRKYIILVKYNYTRYFYISYKWIFIY